MLEQIERDLKAALLSGDKQKTETLRSLKNAVLYETVSLNARESGLSDEQIQKVLAREAKKRLEAAQMYSSVGEQARADSEMAEKEMIDIYLPAQVSELVLKQAVDEEVAKITNPSISDMGKVIGAIKSKFSSSADGALTAKLVKEALSK